MHNLYSSEQFPRLIRVLCEKDPFLARPPTEAEAIMTLSELEKSGCEADWESLIKQWGRLKARSQTA